MDDFREDGRRMGRSLGLGGRFLLQSVPNAAQENVLNNYPHYNHDLFYLVELVGRRVSMTL